MAKVIYRMHIGVLEVPEYYVEPLPPTYPSAWDSVYTGDAIEYANSAAADVVIATLPTGTYDYFKSNPVPGPHRPK